MKAEKGLECLDETKQVSLLKCGGKKMNFGEFMGQEPVTYSHAVSLVGKY